MLLFVTIYYIVHYFEVNFCSVLLAVNIFESNWPWWQMHKTRGLYGLSKLWKGCYCQSRAHADGCFCVVHQDPCLIQNAAVPVSSRHPCLLSIWRRPRSPPASLRAPSPPCPGSPSAPYLRESGEKTGTLALPRVLPAAPPKPLHQVAKQQLALFHIQLRSPLSDSNNWTVREYKIMYVEGSVVLNATIAQLILISTII